MKKKSSIIIFNIVVVAIVALICIPGIVSVIRLIMADGGKLNNNEKISAAVTENQETLDNIVLQVLNPQKEFEIYIDLEEKRFQGLNVSRDIDEKLFNLEDIYCLPEKMDIKGIYAYKNPDVNMVIFETYSSGMAGSSEIKGFLYLEQDFTDNIFEYDYFKVYRSYNYSEITDNWYYFDKSY